MDQRKAWAAVAAALALAAWSAPARASDVNFSGSVFTDFVRFSDAAAREASIGSFNPEASVKLEAGVTEQLAITGKACFSCHGLEVAQAQLEYSPSSRLNVTAGRVIVPFGDFSERYDPSGHRTASKPLIYDMGRMPWFEDDALYLGVVPIPYVDTGAIVHGQVWPLKRLQLWYAVYGVAGFREAGDRPDLDLHPGWGSRRHHYWDNNSLPSFGGRLATSYVSPRGSLLRQASLGGSLTGGRHDAEEEESYRAWGVDATVRVHEVTLRAEYAARRVDLPPGAFGGDRLDKAGWYAELEHPIGSRLVAVYRYDELRREGPTDRVVIPISTDTKVRRYTAGLELRPADAVFVKASFEHYRPTELPITNALHLGVGATF
jgi:hypothetical protein